jgi:hypothetical protein
VVLTAVARQARSEPEQPADTLAYGVALTLSLLYLIALIGILLLAATSSRPMDVLANGALFLFPIQTLVGIAPWAFFVPKSIAKHRSSYGSLELARSARRLRTASPDE